MRSETIEYTTLNTKSVAHQIASRIRDAILEGRLKVDDRLPTEDDLAARFGVSRPTVREALKILGAQNLIRSRRGPAGGSFVRLPNSAEVREQISGLTSILVSVGEFSLFEVAEARLELEQVCCRIAAERRTESDLKALDAELARQRDIEITDIEFCASDVHFHTLLVQATQNAVLRFVMAAVTETLQPVSNMVVYRFRERPLIVRHHEKILTALRERDGDAAVAAVKEQMLYLSKKFAQAQEWREHRKG